MYSINLNVLIKKRNVQSECPGSSISFNQLSFPLIPFTATMEVVVNLHRYFSTIVPLKIDGRVEIMRFFLLGKQSGKVIFLEFLSKIKRLILP